MPKDLNAQQTGLNKSAGVNNARPTPIRGMNTFPQNYVHPSTHSYADVDPFFVMNVVRHDNIPVRCGHDIHSYQLSSPMLSDVVMHKTFISVPMKAIYPRNWDLMLVPPTVGDDVPDDTRFVSYKFIQIVNQLVTSYRNLVAPTAVGDLSVKDVTLLRLRTYFRFLFYLESIFSNGSLFSRMNMHFSDYFMAQTPDGVVREIDFDEFFDLFFSNVRPLMDNFGFDVTYESGVTVKYRLSDVTPFRTTSLYRTVSLGALLEILRNNDFSVVWLDDDVTDLVDFETDFRSIYSDYNVRIIVPYDIQNNLVGFNLEYIPAYQMACAQFMTNEHVDFIYSADMYRRELQSLLYGADPKLPTFDYNGDSFLYDFFSGKVFDTLFARLYSTFNADVNVINTVAGLNQFVGSGEGVYGILSSLQINLFGVRKSLKYGDYFTGARPKPLAVGDVNAPVVGNNVSAVDVTRSISKQRFLNAVNLAGRKIGNYLTALWGGQLPEAPDDVPLFVASESFGIGKQEIENTGALQASDTAQNTVTTQLRSSNSKYLMSAHFDMPAILIGLVHFDAPRIYSRTMTRFAFHYDRYDDFIPQMQYVGDQEIYANELIPNAKGNYAYTMRNMEYKQQYSFASGGFRKFLKSWIFIGDNEEGNPLSVEGKISPEFIRSTNYEFDRFYTSLTGLSLASRFHFIVKHANLVRPQRQMAYRPQILE